MANKPDSFFLPVTRKSQILFYFKNRPFLFFQLSLILGIFFLPGVGALLVHFMLEGSILSSVEDPVEQWLQSFATASMVFTDSFHGTVFSIIFNKPFWVIGNKMRGMARFNTLLSIYGLQDRIISPEELSSVDLNTPIDWAPVNAIREQWKQKSLKFLTDNLK